MPTLLEYASYFLSDQFKEIDPSDFIDHVGIILIHWLIMINALDTPAPDHVQHHYEHRSNLARCQRKTRRRENSTTAKLNWPEFNDQSDKINTLKCQLDMVKEE